MAPGRNTPWNTRVKDERGYDVFIPLRDAAAYITAEFYTALQVFCLCENLGCLPFAGGWAEQPEWIAQALSVLKVERWKIDTEEREEKERAEKDRRKYAKR